MPDVLCNQFLKFPHLHRLVIIIPLQFITAFLNKEIHHFFGFYALADDKFVGAFQQVEDFLKYNFAFLSKVIREETLVDFYLVRRNFVLLD